MSRFRVLVCGGRDYADRKAVFKALDAIRAAKGSLTVIQGGAAGADALAREWCMAQPSVHLINEPADWKAHGRAAGPIRNQRMLDEHKPDLVLAFPGGKGTADMVRRARSAGVPVLLAPDFVKLAIAVPSISDLILETIAQGYDVTIKTRLREDGKEGVVTMPNEWVRRLGMSEAEMTTLRNQETK
jgi:predicted polyphosphate/ATP-dependent NAD kinase